MNFDVKIVKEDLVNVRLISLDSRSSNCLLYTIELYPSFIVSRAHVLCTLDGLRVVFQHNIEKAETLIDFNFQRQTTYKWMNNIKCFTLRTYSGSWQLAIIKPNLKSSALVYQNWDVSDKDLKAILDVI